MFLFSRKARRERAGKCLTAGLSWVECLEERRLLSATPLTARARPFHVRRHEAKIGKSLAVVGQSSTVTAAIDRVKNIDPNAGNVYAFVRWGDGKQSFAEPDSFSYSGNTLTLNTQHNYAAPGEYSFSVQIYQGPPGTSNVGQVLSFSKGTLDVTPDPATPQGAFQVNDLNAVQLRSSVNHSINGAIAAFTSDNPGLRYVAYVDWGDGHFSKAKVAQNSDGSFWVLGKHTYSHRGDYVVQVTLNTTYSFITSNTFYGSAFAKSDAVIQSDA